MEKTSISSLEKKLAETIDLNEKTKIHLELAQKFMRRNFDKSIEHATEVLKIADENSVENYIAQTYFLRKLSMVNSEECIDLGLKLLNRDLTKIPPVDLFVVYGSLIQVYTDIAEFKKGLEICYMVESSILKDLPIKMKAYYYNFAGNLYSRLDYTDLTIETLEKANKIFRELEDLDGESSVLYSLGDVLYNNKKHELALDCFKKVAENDIKMKITEPNILQSSFLQISKCFFKLKNIEEGNTYYKKALDLAYQTKEDLFINRTECEALNFLNLQEKYEETILKGLEVLQKQSLKEDIPTYYSSLQKMGEAFFKLNKFSEAKKYLKSSTKFFEDKEVLEVLAINYQTLLKIFENEGNYKQALFYSKKYTDTINKSNLQKAKSATEQLEIKFKIADKERESERLKIESLSFQLKSLRAQMNPHFVFNAINSITNTMNEQTVAHSKKLLCSFARLMRANLDFADREFISLEEEITFLKDYLALEKSRLGDKLNYNIIFDEDLDIDFIDIPSMILQPYVENAVKHGIMPLIEDGKITIKFEEQDDNVLQCSIEDNGVGRAQASKNKNTLTESLTHESKSSKITATRLQLIFKNPDKFNVTFFDLKDKNNKACGTKVIVLIPIE